jgi:hypothetical protein
MIWLLAYLLPLLSCQQALLATYRKTEKERTTCCRERVEGIK